MSNTTNFHETLCPTLLLHLSKMKGVPGSENHLLTLLSGRNRQEFASRLGILMEAWHLPALRGYRDELQQHGMPVDKSVPFDIFPLCCTETMTRYANMQRIFSRTIAGGA